MLASSMTYRPSSSAQVEERRVVGVVRGPDRVERRTASSARMSARIASTRHRPAGAAGRSRGGSRRGCRTRRPLMSRSSPRISTRRNPTAGALPRRLDPSGRGGAPSGSESAGLGRPRRDVRDVDAPRDQPGVGSTCQPNIAAQSAASSSSTGATRSPAPGGTDHGRTGLASLCAGAGDAGRGAEGLVHALERRLDPPAGLRRRRPPNATRTSSSSVPVVRSSASPPSPGRRRDRSAGRVQVHRRGEAAVPPLVLVLDERRVGPLDDRSRTVWRPAGRRSRCRTRRRAASPSRRRPRRR